MSKYNADGSELLYATYLGGDAEDLPHSMIANTSDHIVLLGSTNSTDYPVSSNAYDTTHNGAKDIVITSLSGDGTSLIGSTYLGGSAKDGVNEVIAYYADDYRGEVVLDSADNIYISSFSKSHNFPVTSGVFQDSLAGYQDGVVCKLSPNLSQLNLSTYLGGWQGDAAYALKVSEGGDVFVAGVTKSDDFPVDTSAAFPTYGGDTTDGFIARLSADFSSLVASSYFGTSGRDRNYFVELDQDDGVYVLGTSNGGVSATSGKYNGPGNGGYIYKTNPTLTSVEYVATFGDLAPAAFLVDNCRRIYVSGQGATSSVLNLNNFDTLQSVNSHATEGVDIGSLVTDLSADLLGCHVAACSLGDFLGMEQFADTRFLFLGDGKVNQLDLAIAADQKVVRLDIQVDPVLGVHVVEPLGRLLNDLVEHEGERVGPAAKRLFHVQFAEQFEHQERPIGIVVVAEDLDHSWAAQVLGNVVFVFQQRDFAFVGSKRLLQHLECVAIV